MQNGDDMETNLNLKNNNLNNHFGYLLKKNKHLNTWKKQYFKIWNQEIIYSDNKNV